MSELRRYLVGGAVRDRLLGLPVKDRDWLVVDTDPEHMLALGYHRVGRQFPVFLHPQTGEEHALPRGTRQHGLAAVGADLRQRDLSINAMALDPEGRLIDPCNGQQDLQQGLLRHLPGFREDPLRVLRVARFSARLPAFSVHPDTLCLMREMVADGTLDGLPRERIFGELEQALRCDAPERFIQVLRDCGALQRLLPELERLFGVPQPPRHHPEIDSGVHTLMTLQQACRLSPEPATRLAALLHDLGKGSTPREQWPSHFGHEERGVALIKPLARRLGLPNEWRELALLVSRYHLHAHRAFELRPATLLQLFQASDALRRPQRFGQFLLACQADACGRSGYEQQPYPQADYLRGMLNAAQAIDAGRIAADCRPPSRIPEALRRARLAAIAQAKGAYPVRVKGGQ